MLGQHLDSSIGTLPSDVLQSDAPQAENSKRRWQRITKTGTVALKSGNSTQRDKADVKGHCRDISRTGFAAKFTSPIGVGDIFYATLTIDGQRPFSVLARCLRCLMFAEDSFEGGFAFFQPVDFAETTDAPAKVNPSDSSLI